MKEIIEKLTTLVERCIAGYEKLRTDHMTAIIAGQEITLQVCAVIEKMQADQAATTTILDLMTREIAALKVELAAVKRTASNAVVGDQAPGR